VPVARLQACGRAWRLPPSLCYSLPQLRELHLIPVVFALVLEQTFEKFWDVAVPDMGTCKTTGQCRCGISVPSAADRGKQDL